MKRLLTLLTAILVFLTATAQAEHSIILDQSTFRKVNADPLTGVNIDPIRKDSSRNACARVKIRFANMSRAEVDALKIQFRSNTDLVRQEIGYYDNILILEMTAKPTTRFYVQSPEYGQSNEVTLNLEGDTEYEMEARLNQTYSIAINTNASGAEVYLDGVKRGVTDADGSLTIKSVVVGKYTLAVDYMGVRAEQQIAVNAGSISFNQNVDIQATEPQYVVFTVNPKSALVIINNKQYTPQDGVVTTVLQPGVYNYTVSARLYHSSNGTFSVSGDKVMRSVTLDPAFGYLSVGGGALAGAAVFVDEELIGTAPVKSDRLSSGEHSVRIVMEKYSPYSSVVTISDNQTTELNPTLSADFATVTLTAPDGATIWVNGTQMGVGSWCGQLSTGAYIFEARKDGHRPQKLTKTISATPSTQSYALDAPTPITGSIDITSTPAMADIYVDDNKVGTTPMKVKNQLVGEHTIKVSMVGYADFTRKITIEEGKTATLNAELTKGGGDAYIAGFEMVYVTGGTFTMGATAEQGSDVYSDEKPTHSVTLSDYYIGKYEVTQAQWRAVMGSNPSEWKGDNLPVENVSWNDIQEFIKKLNAQTGKKFRLPTEAEWEYAARGANQSKGYKYSGSNSISEVSWYTDNSSSDVHPVGQKSPNELGIYDMSGNVWEWCSDWYGSYSSSSQTNSTGPSSGSYRVLRGGSRRSSAGACRVSIRHYDAPDDRNSHFGFRLVCPADTELTVFDIDKLFDDKSMVLVKGGTFKMGATGKLKKDAGKDEKIVRSVTVSDFYIGKYEVTQAQWMAIMGSNPSEFKGENRPVENVSWNDVQEFIRRLNAKTGKKYRLPTEAEWEYAARGGNRSEGNAYYSGCADRWALEDVAWFNWNSGDRTHWVGKKFANKLGIYDMSGNVWEWCQDFYADKYDKKDLVNPTGPSAGSYRVLRGGAWNSYLWVCRVSERAAARAEYRYKDTGFRLVLDAQ